MSATETGRRGYSSAHRQELAAVTRSRILQAGQLLFERDGFAGTTMAAVAAEAGVSLKTVYVHFETKSGLLRALWQLLLAGSDDDAPVLEREWFVEVLEEPDPERQLRLNARNSRRVKARAGAVMTVIRDAARSDDDLRALWELISSDFHTNQAAVVRSLAEKSALRGGLGRAQATDILWTLNHPDTWQLLVTQCGWTHRRYETWTADTACAQLLAART
jgi:AcrR family transcriptional regulator